MGNRNLIREFNVNDDELSAILGETFEDLETTDAKIVGETPDVNTIVDGTILRIEGDEVLVDIGYKSEGVVPLDEWSDGDELPEPGQAVQVLLEEVEEDFGLILLSKRKSDRIREWE